MSDKPIRLPWDESNPYYNHKAAEEKAIAAAQPPRIDPNSPVVESYARTAFDKEIQAVRTAPKHTRQKTLFPAAANLYELVAAGALDEDTVEQALRDACRDNGLEQDDGEPSITRTLVNARRKGFDKPRDLAHVGKRFSYTAGDLTVDEPKKVELQDFQYLERGFWLERDSLQKVYIAALSRMCSPWAVLAITVARALTMVRPCVMLPDIVGGLGSLNWFAAIAAKSGGGKGSANGVARELLKNDALRVRNLGSGEGVIDAYVKPANKETGEPAGRHEAVMFTADEIDTLTTLGNRTGATLSSVLRSGFSGETLGFSYRTASNVHLDAHTYRMTLVIGVQPGRAAALIDDIHTGTLQRFMWFPAVDSRVTEQPPNWPGGLEFPSDADMLKYGGTLKVPFEAVELIRGERVRAQRGEQDSLDSHALYAREKIAYALAILDGRAEMNSDDWRLAGIASRVSDFTRDWVTHEMKKAIEEQATSEGQVYGMRISAANEEKEYREAQRQSRIAQWIRGKLKESDTGLTQRELSRAIASRDRPQLAAVLTRMELSGAVHKEGSRWTIKQALDTKPKVTQEGRIIAEE